MHIDPSTVAPSLCGSEAAHPPPAASEDAFSLHGAGASIAGECKALHGHAPRRAYLQGSTCAASQVLHLLLVQCCEGGVLISVHASLTMTHG